MRKLLLPLAAFIALGAALAYAQTINKAIQLSQDPTGAIGVDTNNGVYFPGHVNSNGPTPAPTLTSCGSSPTITGTDTAAKVAIGSSAPAIGCVITFSQAWLQAPFCVVQSQNPATSAPAYSTSTTAITITNNPNMASATINYVCMSTK